MAQPELRIGVDLSPAVLESKGWRAADLTREVTLAETDARSLPFLDASFDTVVRTLGLCGLPDERSVIVESTESCDLADCCCCSTTLAAVTP